MRGAACAVDVSGCAQTFTPYRTILVRCHLRIRQHFLLQVALATGPLAAFAGCVALLSILRLTSIRALPTPEHLSV